MRPPRLGEDPEEDDYSFDQIDAADNAQKLLDALQEAIDAASGFEPSDMRR